MFGLSGTIKDDTKNVAKAVEKAKFRNFRHAGFSISKAAKSSIQRSREPSSPGSPPHTRGKGRRNLRGAIFVAAEPDSVIIGPRFSYVGESGEAHEFGREYKGDQFDERPFMDPALQAAIPRFMAGWRGSVGE